MGGKSAATLAVVAVALASGTSSCEPRGGDDPCTTAFDARAWSTVVDVCTSPQVRDRATLARAWVALRAGHPADALLLAASLAGTGVAVDAAYLSGHAHAHGDDPVEHARARSWFWQALIGYRLTGRHRDASRTAGFLSRIPRPSAHFDDELYFAEVSVSEAAQSGDRRAQGGAETALAEVYDNIGMTELARERFFHAEELLAAWPQDLAFTYLKHALFILDLGTEGDLRAALQYLAAATEQAERAAAGGNADVASVLFAVHLNRADALAQLGDLAGAARELEITAPDEASGRKLDLVRGYVAARRGDLRSAEELFAAANDGALKLDYRWRVAMEIGELHRSAGRMQDAERAFRDAVATVEELRRAAGEIELRPWVLARRTLPYAGLFQVLVAQGRGADALAVAESLHARTWLDVVLGRNGRVASTTAQVLLDARLRQQVAAGPALDGAALLARVGDREVLVFLSVGPTTWRAHAAHGQVEFAPLSPSDLEAVAAFRRTPPDPRAAELAGAALIPPAVAAGDQPLYIVASGPLADLSFAALRRGGHFLIDDRPVARLPGLAALACGQNPWSDRQVFVGDSLGDLREAAAEVRQLGGPSAHVGAAATRAVVESARNAALLHLAVHGRLTAAGGALDLADGPFTAASVLDAGIAPRVVILTGCATAASNDAEAWGGFPSAFLAAGSRHVVATLHSVTDADAAAFARAYYHEPAALGPVARLAAAQRALAKDRPVAAWASFAVWGDADCDGDAR